MVLKRYGSDFIKVGRDLASVGSFGFLMAAAILLGYFVGNFLDDYFGTSPWFLIIFLILGIVGGSMEYFNILKKIIKDPKLNKKHPKKKYE